MKPSIRSGFSQAYSNAIPPSSDTEFCLNFKARQMQANGAICADPKRLPCRNAPCKYFPLLFLSKIKASNRASQTSSTRFKSFYLPSKPLTLDLMETLDRSLQDL
jgi:hypothetical protein